MTTRPTLASVVIPNQHQQVTTQQEQTETHSSQPPIFSKPPFKPQNTNKLLQLLHLHQLPVNMIPKTTGKLAERDNSQSNKLAITKTKLLR